MKNVHHYRAIQEEDTNRQVLHMEATTRMDITHQLHMQDNHQQAPTQHQVKEGLMLLRVGLMGVMGASLREDTMDTTSLQVSTSYRAAEEAGDL